MTAGKPNRRFLHEEYRSRINRVMDHIEANIGREMSLSELADIALFSPYHFHRIFSAMTGETLGAFIQRLRVEKAAAKLVGNPRRPITDIALDCGFSGSSAFARAFRERYGMSASAWRSGGAQAFSKNGRTERKDGQTPGNTGQDSTVAPRYTAENGLQWRVEMKETDLKTEVTVKEMPDMHVAYVRHIGPYKGDEALFGRLINRLMAWAGPRGLIRMPETKMLMVYYDDPELTDDSRLRTDVCITVPEGTETSGEVGSTIIPTGSYAVGRFEISPDRYQEAWNVMYGTWLPESGYQPAEGPCYENMLNDPSTYPEGKHIFEICIPVKPL